LANFILPVEEFPIETRLALNLKPHVRSGNAKSFNLNLISPTGQHQLKFLFFE